MRSISKLLRAFASLDWIVKIERKCVSISFCSNYQDNDAQETTGMLCVILGGTVGLVRIEQSKFVSVP